MPCPSDIFNSCVHEFYCVLEVNAIDACNGKDERVRVRATSTSTKNSDSENRKILNKFIDITLSILTAPCGINRSRLHFVLDFFLILFLFLFLPLLPSQKRSNKQQNLKQDNVKKVDRMRKEVVPHRLQGFLTYFLKITNNLFGIYGIEQSQMAISRE